MATDFNVDFTRRSQYDENSSTILVRYGADGPVTELDLNEMQLVQNKKQRDFVKSIINDGLSEKGTIAYADGTVTITDEYAFVSGYLIKIDNISIPVSNNDTIYLNVYIREITRDSVMYKYGNLHGTPITNYINDNRFDKEITRREQLVYELSTTMGTEMVLEVGKMIDNAFSFTYTKSGAVIDDSHLVFMDDSDEFIPETEYSIIDAQLDITDLKDDVKALEPLTSDLNLYVSTTGSDADGDGSITKPFFTIDRALKVLPDNLGGYTGAINISDGTYDEDVVVKGISNGYIRLQRNGVQELNDLCNVKSIRVENCNSVSISGLNLTTTDTSGIFGTRTDFINVSSCQSVSNANTQVSFNFDYVSVVRISGNRSLNHNICLRAYASDVYSEHWSSDSIGNYGIFLEGSGRLSKGNTFQPRGTIADENTQSGSIISSKYGAKIGNLSSDINLYVATTGSDTTGDGTSVKPFKTIQYAFSTIPKDLGGYTAYIYIADGIYDEGVVISSFHNGVIGVIKQTNPLSISTNCSVRWITMQYCSCRIYLSGLNLFGNGSEGACVGIDCADIIIRFLSVTSTDLTKIGFSFDACRARVENSKVINHNIALRSYNSYCGSASWTADSTGNNIGLRSDFNSVIVTTGAQPQATLIIQPYSGAFIYENGTQISGPFGGLSCTWGTIVGGYYRHGMCANGQAMVTMQISVTISSTLSSGTNYTINGLPIPSGTVPVNCQVGDHFGYKTIIYTGSGSTGQMVVQPIITIQIGNVYHFSATYMTNS